MSPLERARMARMDDAERRDLQQAADWDLNRYREARRNIDHFKDKIQRLRDRANAVSRPPDPDRIFVQNDNGNVEEILTTIVDMQRDNERKQLEAERLCAALDKRISAWTNGIEKRILRDYYLFNQTLEWIAVNEDKSYSQIKRLRWKALENYGKRLKDFENEPQ